MRERGCAIKMLCEGASVSVMVLDKHVCVCKMVYAVDDEQ